MKGHALKDGPEWASQTGLLRICVGGEFFLDPLFNNVLNIIIKIICGSF